MKKEKESKLAKTILAYPKFVANSWKIIAKGLIKGTKIVDTYQHNVKQAREGRKLQKEAKEKGTTPYLLELRREYDKALEDYQAVFNLGRGYWKHTYIWVIGLLLLSIISSPLNMTGYAVFESKTLNEGFAVVSFIIAMIIYFIFLKRSSE